MIGSEVDDWGTLILAGELVNKGYGSGEQVNKVKIDPDQENRRGQTRIAQNSEVWLMSVERTSVQDGSGP
jgi:hypothetical protein